MNLCGRLLVLKVYLLEPITICVLTSIHEWYFLLYQARTSLQMAKLSTLKVLIT